MPQLPNPSPLKPCAQVSLYLPQQAHDSFGVVRAVVKDSTDNSSTGARAASFLDSDGQVGVSASRDSSAHLSGRWHMVRATRYRCNA